MNRYNGLPSRVAFSRNSRPCLSIGTCFLSLVGLFCCPVGAQHGIPTAAPTSSQPEIQKDALGRSTPKGTVLAFLIAARNGDYELAARYLNTQLRGDAAEVLAHKLFVVLDRRLPPRLNQLSDNPEGSLADPLDAGQELVGSISSDGSKLDVFVERVDRGDSRFIWLFSKKTLEAIPDLYDEINAVPVERILPGILVNARFAGIPLFEWLAVVVGMPLFYFLTALPNPLVRRLASWLHRRLHWKPGLPIPESLPIAVRLLLLAWAIRWLISEVSLPLLARQFWVTISAVITISASVWLLIQFASWSEAYVSRSFQSRNLPGATSILRLARWVVDLLIIFAGVLVSLYYFGVNPTAALAGLGVGGIAVALAAQKTLENVLGGVSLILDQAVRVGDTLKVGDTTGTVEEIGLRSTRLRTVDRTVVSVPNGQMANMSVENLSAREKFWLHPILRLRYDTSVPQINALLAGIRNLLQENTHVEPSSIRVRFLRFGPSSLDVEVFAYVLARDWSQFLEIQEGLQLHMMECVESSGVQIALPSLTIHLSETYSSRERDVHALLETSDIETQAADQPVLKSA